ncbi:Arginine--tRNA ligase, cytoplasmic [Cucumispora dikerogammari]|nr:Arginine--tRNA ligase, cytoplasmic [Cucumispora dikerogammari]
MSYESTFYTIREELLSQISSHLVIPKDTLDKFLNNAKLTDTFHFKLELHGILTIHKMNITEITEKLINPINNTINKLATLSVSDTYNAALSFEKIGNIIKKMKLEGNTILIFLNIPAITPYVLNDAYTKGKNFGQREPKESIVLVEYSSPNIAKQFHPGHLRTTMIGNFLARLYKKFGYKVLSINYLGDYGKQFGLIIEGLKRFPNEEKFNEEPTKYAYEIYVKISNLAKTDESVSEAAKENFKKLEDNDEETLLIWKKLRDMSIIEFKNQYDILNVEFDIFSGESFFGKPVVSDNLKCDEDGSKYFDMGKLGKSVVQRSNGTTLYASRDIHAGIERCHVPNVVKSIYVVASQQDLYFKQLFEIFRIEGIKTECLHINYGMVKDMSTRAGTVIFMSDILKTATEKMLAVIEKNEAKFASITDPKNTALQLSLSAILIQDFSAKRIKDYTFDFDRFTSIEGNTGPYLQYTHCRLESIRKKNYDIFTKQDYNVYDAGFENQNIQELLKNVQISGAKVFKTEKTPEKHLKLPFNKIHFSVLDTEDIHECISLIIRYDYVLDDSLSTHEPCKIVTYAMQLCRVINRLFSSCKVFGETEEISISRLYIFETLRFVLSSLIEVLGLRPLDRI